MKQIGFSKNSEEGGYISEVITIESSDTFVLRVETSGSSNVNLERSITGNNWVSVGRIAYGNEFFEQNILGLKEGQKIRLKFQEMDSEDKNVPKQIFLL